MLVTTGLYLGACFFLPKNYSLEKSLIINSPTDLVYEQILYFENWKKWNPFLNGNKQISTLASAEDGVENSYLRWKNNKGNEGKITVLKIDDLKKIDYLISVDKPKSTIISGYISLEPDINNTKVTIHFEGNNPFYMRILNIFIEKQYEKDLSETLEMLEKAAVKEYDVLKNEYFGYKIKDGFFEERNIGFVRKTIKYTELQEFFDDNFGKLKKEAKNCGFSITGNKLSLMYKPDDINQVYNVAAALPLKGDSTLGSDFEMMKLQKQKAIFLNYYGGNHSISKAEEALKNYSKNKKLSIKKPYIREHIKSIEQVTDSNKWHTVIWFLIN